METKHCTHCKKPMVRRHYGGLYPRREAFVEYAVRKYCSRACAAADRRQDLGLRHCEQCGAAFGRRRVGNHTETADAFLNRKYCCRDCYLKARWE